MKAIQTKYVGPTDTRGPRMRASDGDRNQTTIAYDNDLTSEENHKAAAVALCRKMDWDGEIIGGSFPDCMVWVFTNIRRGVK